MPTAKEWYQAFMAKPLPEKIKLTAIAIFVFGVMLPIYLTGRCLLFVAAPIKALAFIMMWKPYSAKDSLREAWQVSFSLGDIL